MADYIKMEAIISPTEIGRDVLVAELSEIGFESFVETDTGVEAYIASGDFDDEALKRLSISENDNFSLSYTISTIPGKNWNEVWEKQFEPIYIDNLCAVRASFHEQREGVKYDIVITPKMSFGTGHHETTYLMLKQLLQLEVKDKAVTDVGCGTGVLAILTKMMGATEVIAVDNDEWAYHNAIENTAANGLDITVKYGGIETVRNQKSDLVLANINRNVLLEQMGLYAQHLNDKGSLLLSGFYTFDKELLLQEANKHGLRLIEEMENNDWALLHLKKEMS